MTWVEYYPIVIIKLMGQHYDGKIVIYLIRCIQQLNPVLEHTSEEKGLFTMFRGLPRMQRWSRL